MKSFFSFLIGILLFLPLNGQSAVKQRSATSAYFVLMHSIREVMAYRSDLKLFVIDK